jgi:hypothetical protein
MKKKDLAEIAELNQRIEKNLAEQKAHVEDVAKKAGPSATTLDFTLDPGAVKVEGGMSTTLGKNFGFTGASVGAQGGLGKVGEVAFTAGGAIGINPTNGNITGGGLSLHQVYLGLPNDGKSALGHIPIASENLNFDAHGKPSGSITIGDVAMVNALGNRNLNFIPAVTVPIDGKGIHAPIVSLSGNADFKPSNNVTLSPHVGASVNTENSQIGASAGMMTQVSLSENVLLKLNAAVTAANIGDTNDIGMNAQLSITGQPSKQAPAIAINDSFESVSPKTPFSALSAENQSAILNRVTNQEIDARVKANPNTFPVFSEVRQEMEKKISQLDVDTHGTRDFKDDILVAVVAER